jgi:hypothetical protein
VKTRKKVPQPPIQREARDPERHSFWPGSAAVLIGLAVLVCGARHITSVETTEGDAVREAQLVKAFSSGGIQYVDLSVPAPPPDVTDPVAMAQYLERLDRQALAGPKWKVKVNAGANTPCPT